MNNPTTAEATKAIKKFVGAGKRYSQARKACIAVLCPQGADRAALLGQLKKIWLEEKDKSHTWDSSCTARNTLQYLFKGIAQFYGFQNISTVHWEFTGSAFAKPKTADAKASAVGQTAQTAQAQSALVAQQAQALVADMSLQAQVASLIKAFGLAAVVAEIQAQAANAA